MRPASAPMTTSYLGASRYGPVCPQPARRPSISNARRGPCTGDGSVDEPHVKRAAVLPAEPHRHELPRNVVLDEHVHGAHEAPHDLEPLRALQVHRHRTLVTVRGAEVRGLGREVRRCGGVPRREWRAGRAPGSCAGRRVSGGAGRRASGWDSMGVVAVADFFYLDPVRPEVREQHRRVRPREDTREIEDAHALQRRRDSTPVGVFCDKSELTAIGSSCARRCCSAYTRLSYGTLAAISIWRRVGPFSSAAFTNSPIENDWINSQVLVFLAQVKASLFCRHGLRLRINNFFDYLNSPFL